MPARSRSWLAALRISELLLATLFLYALMRVRLLGREQDAKFAIMARWDARWGRWARRILGYKLVSHGPPPPPGALLIPNHTTYLDIFALSALLPIFFVPKADISAWPIVGRVVKGAGHVYIERARKRALIEATRQIADRLRLAQRVVVFLEGTTSNGEEVLTFKPSMLQPALEIGAPIVPVGITWAVDSSANSNPVDVAEEIAYWRKEHRIGAHAWHVLGLRGLWVKVCFGEPIQINPASPPDRLALAEKLHAEVKRLRSLNMLEDSAPSPVIAAPSKTS